MLRRWSACRSRRLSLLLLAVASVAAQQAAPAAAAEAPSATVQDAAQVDESTALLRGRVNPNGSAVATCRFEYGTTTQYGAVAACSPSSLGSGNANVPVTAALSSLEPGTTYHFRLTAAGLGGAGVSVDRQFTTAGEPTCPNAARRLEQGILAILLPDCMALEQVSEPLKFSQRTDIPVISLDGDRVSYKTPAALGDTPAQYNAPEGDVYVASRGDGSWTTQATSPPPVLNEGWNATNDLARSFDPSLTRWVSLHATDDQVAEGISQLFSGRLGGEYEALSPLLVPLDGNRHGNLNVSRAALQGLSADHSKAVFVGGDPNVAYLPGDPSPGGSGFDGNAYVAFRDASGVPSLKLVARDEAGPNAGTVWGGRCGARLGDTGERESAFWRNQGAISADGSRMYFSTRPAQPAGQPCSLAPKTRVLVRSEGPDGLADIEHLVPNGGAGECDRVAPECSLADGNDFFQGASVDGRRVYILSNRQLADSDLDSGGECNSLFAIPGCDLYLYDSDRPAGERMVQVSAGEAAPGHPTPGSGAAVYRGTVAISTDGTRVYFVAAGNLTEDPNPNGVRPADVAGATPKLYMWDAGSETIAFVGPLAAGDEINLWGRGGTYLNAAYPVPVTGTGPGGEEVGGDGHVLFFQSRASLTPNDADGGFVDSFRYDGDASPPSLICVSCKPGGPDSEPQNAQENRLLEPKAVGTNYSQFNRWVSEDGASAIVRTPVSLTTADTDDRFSDYLWRDGKLHLLPGTSPLGSSGFLRSLGQPVLSRDGAEVAFIAYVPLLPSDRDTARDVYVARVGGGFPFPHEEEVCAAEGCLPPPSGAPPGLAPVSEWLRGAGNVRVEPQRKRCGKKRKLVRRNGKEFCRKRTVRKRGGKKKARGAARRAVKRQGGLR